MLYLSKKFLKGPFLNVWISKMKIKVYNICKTKMKFRNSFKN
jgi:hypothetical protein